MKVPDDGTYERARESGTEQNYNMIDGCVTTTRKAACHWQQSFSVGSAAYQLEIEAEEQGQQQQQERTLKTKSVSVSSQPQDFHSE